MKHLVHNLIILDESGSMESIKRPTIQSFNEIIQTARAMEKQFPEQEHRISFLTFNGVGRTIHLWNQPVAEAALIDETKYNPDATTPLYDAMGLSISRLHTELSDIPEHNVLVTIFTDGEENASVEWKGSDIKKLVEKLQNRNWTFTYIGTDHDVSQSADRIAIKNVMAFSKDEEGIAEMFEVERQARFAYNTKIRNKESTREGFYKENKGGQG